MPNEVAYVWLAVTVKLTTLSGVSNKNGSENDDRQDDGWEKRPALKADLLAFALLRELGDFLR